jgi:hypothetical protein
MAPGVTQDGLITYEVTAGSVPEGMRLWTDGLLSGTPQLPGQAQFTVTAHDDAGHTGSRAYTLDVDAPADLVNFIRYTATTLIFGKTGCVGVPLEQILTQRPIRCP